MTFTPNHLSQRDPRWKDEKLGFDNSLTIGTDGCALTCLALFVNGYGFNETPSSLNQKLKAMGPGAGFLGGLIVWSGLTRAFPRIVYRDITICRDQPAPLAAINASLDSGQPIIVEVDRSPSPGLQNHWVVLYQRQGSDYLMLDPWPQPPDNKETGIVGRFGQGREAAQVITAVVWYQATGTQPPPAPPTEGTTVRVSATATAGLRLRSAPSTSSLILATEPPGTLLKCFESEAVVLAKLGVAGQWLMVSDPDYEVGYVAAWYVERPGAPPPPPPASGLKVYVMQSAGSIGLRLRSAPSTTASILASLPVGTELDVLEDKTKAQAKVGQMNQWLNVRDPGDRSGYVAAWYVELAASPPPVPGGLTVSVSGQATAGLNLREAPSPSARVKKVLPAGTLLQVLEPEETARPKIGVVNQWLSVKEPAGETGYVAAWYVEK